MWVYKFFIAVIISFQSLFCFGQIEDNAEGAFRIANETQRPVLLIFSGSDWCAPCIRFEKKVLSEKGFLEFAKENLVILKADFPQRLKLSKELQNQNEALAEQFNPKGIFPTLLLLREDKSILSALNFRNQTSEEFILDIKESLR